VIDFFRRGGFVLKIFLYFYILFVLFFILKSLLDLVIQRIDFHVYLNLVTALFFFALFMTLLDFVLKRIKRGRTSYYAEKIYCALRRTLN
jgi:Na+/phosphate symporter